MLQFIRTNTGLLISVALLGGGAFVCTILGLMMSRAGASLRPILWFAGFFALIVLPQLIGHFYLAVHAAKNNAPRTAALEQLAHSDGGASRTDDVKVLFGPDADPQLVIDVRQAQGEVFANAEQAQFAVLPNGDTVLLARFTSSSAAEKGWTNYLRVSGLNQLAGQGDSQRGYAVTRAVGDRAYVLHQHNLVGIWTGKDDAAIRQRMSVGGFEIPRRAPLADVAAGVTPAVEGGILPPGKDDATNEFSALTATSATTTSHPRTGSPTRRQAGYPPPRRRCAPRCLPLDCQCICFSSSSTSSKARRGPEPIAPNPARHPSPQRN